MPSFNLPASPFREAPALPQPAAPALRPALSDHPPSDHPPSNHPPSSAPAAPGLSKTRRVFAALSRLQASFARSEAVHQSRLDACLTGPEWHLLARYACSVK